MRINEPVTNVEHVMKDGEILVSKTNLRGIVTSANQPFIDIAGFSEDELVGKNHNVVRHPDMPPEAFQDLWDTIKDGRPWLGYVKNRCKSGDYYWVEANVSPVYKNGQIVEYLSVRSKPSATAVDAATRLYQKIKEGKATLHPTGVFAKIKRAWSNSSLKLRLGLFLLISAMFMWYASLSSSNWSPDLGTIIDDGIATALLILIFFWANSAILKHLEIIRESMQRMSEENFTDQFDILRMDEVGRVYQMLKTMQNNQRANVARDREQMAVTGRIKQALDNVNSNVMVSDPNLNIIYMNKAVADMFKNSEADIRKDLPEFDASNLMGRCIDDFHKNPAHQRNLLGNLSSTYASTLHIGGRTFDVIANPVKAEDGTRLGTVVEWKDRTNEVAVEKEVESIVMAAQSGNLEQRLEVAGKEGFFKLLSEGINEMLDTISSSFNDIARVIRSMSDGNLTQKITADYEGTYGEIKNDINSTIDKLEDVIGKIIESSNFFKNTSEEIASGNNNLSQRAEEQASALEETASSMEQLTGTVKNNADNSQQANQLATSARDMAEKGGNVVKDAVSAMEEINRSSSKIAEIISVIDEIAFQTNLLALNASVEAARAGEQGRGFAVVATEVRNLAGRSATAAKEIKDLINDSVDKVQNGSKLVNESGETLNEIVVSVKKVGDIISEIAAASAEQSAGIDQINKAVAQMDEMTQQNAALAEEASAASESSVAKAEDLVQLMQFFKTSDVLTTQNVAMGSAMKKSPMQKPKPAVKSVSSTKRASLPPADLDDEWEEF